MREQTQCRGNPWRNARPSYQYERSAATPNFEAETAMPSMTDVRIQPGSESRFFRSATLEILSKGQVAMRLPGVPEAESFRRAIINAYKAWVPGKAGDPIISASESSRSM